MSKNIYSVRWLPFFMFSLFSLCNAQSLWHPVQTPKEFSAEYFHPNLKITIGTFSGYGVNFTGRIPLTERKIFVVQLPYVRGQYKYSFLSISNCETQDVFGNLYLGLESKRENSRSFLNFGIFLPTTRDDKISASVVGLMGDPDQYESYVPNYLIVSFRINNMVVNVPSENFGIMARVGVSGMVLTKRQYETQDGFDALLSYAIQPTYSSEEFSFTFGFSGKMLITQGGDLSDRVLHQIGLAVSFKVGNVRPEIFGRIPVNKYLSDVVTSTYGGGVTVEL